MGRGKRFATFKASYRRRLVEAAAEDQVRRAAVWSRLADDEEVRGFDRARRCLVCGGERQRGKPLCEEHYREAYESALTHIESDLARQERSEERVERCGCGRKERYRCGRCQAHGLRPRLGYLWCLSCHGVGEWGSYERTGCEACDATGYLSEADAEARLGPAFAALKRLLAEHGRELRAQRLEIWEGEGLVRGLDLSDRDRVFRYAIGLAGETVSVEVVGG